MSPGLNLQRMESRVYTGLAENNQYFSQLQQINHFLVIGVFDNTMLFKLNYHKNASARTCITSGVWLGR